QVSILHERNANLFVDELRVSFVTQHVEPFEMGQEPSVLVMSPDGRHECDRRDRGTRGETQLADGRGPDAAALDDDALALAEPLPLTIAGLADAGEEQQSDGCPRIGARLPLASTARKPDDSKGPLALTIRRPPDT